MRKKRVFAVLAVLMAVCTAAYAVNMQGLLMNAGIEWMGNTLRVFYPIDLDNGWKIKGTAINTNAVELNALSGSGLSAAELRVLDAVAPGTSANSKAVVLSDTGKINALDITALSVNAENITAKVTGVTAGTVTPGKMIVPGALGVINALDITALKLGGDLVTATAAAINGFMGSGLIAAEVGYLSGSTAGTLVPEKCVVVDAAGTIDALDITSLSLGTFAVTASATELNYLAGLTPGTAAAGQAVVLGITGEVDALDITALTLNGTLVNATATELDTLSAVVAGTLSPEKALVVDAAGQISALDIVSPSINGVALLATATDLNSVPDIQEQVDSVKAVRTFTESTGEGTYTATVPIPAGYTVVDVRWINAALWTALTSATMDVGDDADPDGYLDGVDVKADPALGVELSTLLGGIGTGVYAGLPKAYPAAKTITATVVTVGATGDIGRSTLIVEMVNTANCVAAASKL